MKSVLRRFGKPGKATIQNKNRNPSIGPSKAFEKVLEAAMEKGKEGKSK